MSLMITGCASNNTAITPLFCEMAEPIYIGQEDVLTDITARGILTHNLIGKRLCAWPSNAQ
ncbi:hypothetical protein [Photorhabdus asymbiotica]|uniref:hypothetical protein n=2 Tax=Photorhabdus asymbiotica TaxID=291112 RepID=UPI003DA78C8A